jgi:hypothetical protein
MEKVREIMVDKNRIEGAVENTIGKIEDTAEQIAGDAPLRPRAKPAVPAALRRVLMVKRPTVPEDSHGSR